MKNKNIYLISDFRILLKYAREEAKARKSGDPKKIKEATERHETYKKICLESDEMIIPSIYD